MEACAQLAERAYAEIECVSERMSFHDPTSELSRLNRMRIGRWMPVSAGLADVLRLALELQRRTGGAFNAAIGQALVAWRLLPGTTKRVAWDALTHSGFAVESKLGDARARRLLPVRIDLGGIAKGYAVDCAVDAIRNAAPSASGCVNAGGDLRVFGPEKQVVWVRAGTPKRPNLRPVALKEQSLATSSVIPVRRHSPYVDIRRRKPLLQSCTAVVRAERCMVADALSKVVLLMPQPGRAGFEAASRVAAAYGAEISLLP